MNSKFKVYYYYHNINLWKNKSINKLNKKKWVLLKNKSYKNIDGRIYSIGKYICHYKKLNITRLYYFKFINKQILKKYFVNYKEYSLKKKFLNNLYNLERRLDFNLYKANFVTSLYEAKFFITKGFIFVNKKCVTNFSYLLNTGDIVEVNDFLYHYILKRKTFTNIDQYLYLRNLEIDYKTLSFIFLNKSDFFITNYNNFIKKIYFKQDKSNTNIITNNNNFYKFFDKIFTEFLFLDKYNKILTKNTKYISNHKVNILLKFIKYKYNDYYFRNILLKSTFNIKYNYLQFLMSNNIFTNYNFENINFIYKNLFNYNYNNKGNSLLLNTQFFNYYYILIFNYYINILKNLNKINTNSNAFFSLMYLYLTKNFSINNYNYILLFNFKIFKLLNIKNKLNNYYNDNLFIKNNNINSNFQIINNNNNYITKKINYKTISQYSNSKFHYNSSKIYNNLIYYISSYKFGYKIHKRSRNFQQNCTKRSKIIKKIQKSFYYTRFNCNRYGIYIKKNTKRTLYNQLKNNYLKIYSSSNNNINEFKIKKITKQNNNKIITINKLNSPYYPKNSIIYKSIYNSLNVNSKNNINIIRENIKKLNSLNITLKEFNNEYLINYIYKLEKQLYYKLKFIQNNSKTTDYNFNKNFKDIYFLYNLIEFYNHKTILLNNNKILLKTIYSNVIYKIHNKITLNYNNQILKNKNKKFYIKKYKHLVNDYRRYQLNSYYINYNKSRTSLSSNLKSYFLKNLINNNNKIFFNYYYCYIKLNFFNNFNINFYKKNKRNILKVKYNKRINNIYKSYYLSKYKNLIYNTNFNKVNDAKDLFNINIINSSKNNFNDKFFYIDLILNLTTRKFNINYNKFNYYLYTTNLKSLTINNLINYKNSIKSNNIYKKNKKVKYINKYNYRTYFIQSLNKIYNYNYLKYNNNNKIIKYKTFTYNYQNKLIYNYNINYYNIFLNNQLFKYYYGYYNSKFYRKNNTKIYIKFNKQNYVNNMYKLYTYYNYSIKKYSLIKYIFKNYIFKEYTCFINTIINNNNVKKIDNFYIKQLYYNLLFTKLFNFNQLDYTLKNNFNYSKNLRIIINYFIIINRLYK